MRMCEDLGQATGVENQHDDTKYWHNSVYLWFSLGVCISRKRNPRGRTRLQRTNISHTDKSEIAFSPRSRKYGSSACLSVMCEKWGFEWTAEKSFIQSPEAHLFTTNNTYIMYFIVLWRPASHSTKLRAWRRQNNDLWIVMFLAMRKCVGGEHIKHMCQFHILINHKYITPTVVGATSAFCAVTIDRRL